MWIILFNAVSAEIGLGGHFQYPGVPYSVDAERFNVAQQFVCIVVELTGAILLQRTAGYAGIV